jgi:hypothetical protein
MSNEVINNFTIKDGALLASEMHVSLGDYTSLMGGITFAGMEGYLPTSDGFILEITDDTINHLEHQYLSEGFKLLILMALSLGSDKLIVSNKVAEWPGVPVYEQYYERQNNK